MSESTIRAQLASIIEGAVSTSSVHAHAIKITSEEEVIAAFDGGTNDAEGRAILDGWVVFPGSYTTKALTATCGFRESTYTFSIYGYRSLIDGQEALMETDVNALLDALVTPANMNTLTPSAVVAEARAQVGPASLAGITVWEAAITVEVVEYPH